jgi:hypothetical protein
MHRALHHRPSVATRFGAERCHRQPTFPSRVSLKYGELPYKGWPFPCEPLHANWKPPA